MDTTLHTARTRHEFVRTHATTPPQSTVSGQPPKVYAPQLQRPHRPCSPCLRLSPPTGWPRRQP